MKSKEFSPIIFFFCTCLVYNWVGVLSLLCIWDVLVLFIIYFFYFVYLKYLTWRAAVSSPPVFGQQVASLFRVATGTSTISRTRERSGAMLWSLVTPVGLLGSGAARGQRDPTEPWGSEFGWTVKAEPVCVRTGFPCSSGASYSYWLHTWRAWPCPALPVPAPAGRGLCLKPRLGKRRFVRTLICPGVFSKIEIVCNNNKNNNRLLQVVFVVFRLCFGFFFS